VKENKMEKETLSEGVVNIIRGCVRPFCTFFGLVSCVMVYVNYQEVPVWLLSFTGAMLAFWFGEKAIVRGKEYLRWLKVIKGK